MPALNIVRTTSIESSPETVFKTLNNLTTWMVWSPWLIMEPYAQVDISDDGNFYSWTGNRVGSGEMKITGEKENESVFYDLIFLEPWKSEAKVTFDIIQNGDNTDVKWSMDSSLPWFMFWMKGMMQGFISMDFDRGLNMLKDYIEKGEINSKLEFKGESEFPGITYIGTKTTCKMDNISEAMESDFGKLGAFIGSHPQISAGALYTIYHKWKIAKRETTYTACFKVDTVPDNLPNGFFAGEIPVSRVYTLRHIGSYKHLGNAWTTLMSMERGKEFKKNKSFDPFEEYVSDPRETDEKDLITDIHFGVK